jgi:hypothetical protein
MRCSVCDLELEIERRGDELVATYNFVAFQSSQCPCRELGPLVCTNVWPAVEELRERGVATKGFGPCESDVSA